jgi:hypothetical protein
VLIAWNWIGIVTSDGNRLATIRKAAPPNNDFGWRKPTLKPFVSQPKPADGPLDRVVMVLLP